MRGTLSRTVVPDRRPEGRQPGNGEQKIAVSVRLAIAALAAISMACADAQRTPTAPSRPLSAVPEILDGSREGNRHFFFLPPLVKQATYAGVSDATASPTVIVCEWNEAASGGGQCVRIIAQFSRDAGTASEVINYDGSQYLVNWHTDRCVNGPCTLDPAKTYRIRVLIGATEIGHTDVDVVGSGKELKNVDTDDQIALLNGRTLPLKFRIEQGAATLVASGGSAPVGSSGGDVATSDGKTAVSIPAGALPATTPISIAQSTGTQPGAGTWAKVVDLGPDGTTFAKPVRLTIGFDRTQLPAGVVPEALKLSTWVGDHWEQVSGSFLNAADASVSGDITHFSTYALVIWPNAVAANAPAGFMLVGQATQVSSATYMWQTVPQTYCYPSSPLWVSTFLGGYWTYPPPFCVTYNTTQVYFPSGIPVTWASSAAGTVALTGPASSLTVDGIASIAVTGVALGTASISALAAGLTSSTSMTVATPPVINPFPQGSTQLVLPVIPGTTGFADAPISNAGGYPLTNLQAIGPFRNCYNGTPYPWVSMAFTPETSAPTTLHIEASPPAGTTLGVYDVCFTLRGLFAADRPYGVRVSVQQVVVANPPIINPFPQGGTQNTLTVQAGTTASKAVPVSNLGGGTLSGLSFVGPAYNCYNGVQYPWLTHSWAATTAPTTLTLIASPPEALAPGQYDLCFEIQARAVGAMDRWYGIRLTVTPPPAWTTVAPMPTPRWGTAAVAIGNIIYTVGGNASPSEPHPGGPAVAVVEAYNVSTNQWSTKASLPVALEHANVVAHNGRIYVIGGWTCNLCGSKAIFEYDPATDTWTQGPNAPHPIFGGASASIGGLIYTTTSGCCGSPGQELFSYDPATSIWTALPTIPQGHSFVGGGAVINGKLYVVGGENPVSYLDVYDPATNTWASKAPMPVVRMHGAAVAINGKLYVFPGYNDGAPAPTDVYVYDPTANTWSVVTQAPRYRNLFGAALVNGAVYLFGGNTAVSPGSPIATVDRFVP